MRTRTVRPTLFAVLVLFALAIPTPSAHASGLGYDALAPTLQTANVGVPRRSARTAKATCPSGTRLLTGGTFFFEPGQPSVPTSLARFGRLSASYPSGNTWIATGFNHRGPKDLRLEAVALCTTESIEIDITTVTTKIGSHSSAGLSPHCATPEGVAEQAVAMGAILRVAHRAKAASSWLTELSAAGLTAGQNTARAPATLTAILICTRSLEQMNRPDTYAPFSAGETAGGYLQCPTATHAIGAYGALTFDEPLDFVDTSGVAVAASSPTFSGTTPGTSWYTAVYDINRPSVVYETVPGCLPDA